MLEIRNLAGSLFAQELRSRVRWNGGKMADGDVWVLVRPSQVRLLTPSSDQRAAYFPTTQPALCCGKLQTRWSFWAASRFARERSEKIAGPPPFLMNTGVFLGEKQQSHHMSEARPGCSTSQQDGNHSKRAALPPVYGNMFYGNMTAEINLSEVGGITIRNSTQGGGKHLSEKAPTQTPSIRQFSWRENIVVAMETESWSTSWWWGKLKE